MVCGQKGLTFLDKQYTNIGQVTAGMESSTQSDRRQDQVGDKIKVAKDRLAR
jgi:hypothetical protein